MIAIKNISLSLLTLFSIFTLKSAEHEQPLIIRDYPAAVRLAEKLYDVLSIPDLTSGSEKDHEAHQLIQQGAVIWTAHIEKSISCDNVRLFKALLKKATEQHPKAFRPAGGLGFNSLLVACHYANVKMVKLALAAGASVNYTARETPFPPVPTRNDTASLAWTNRIPNIPLVFAIDTLDDKLEQRKEIVRLLCDESILSKDTPENCMPSAIPSILKGIKHYTSTILNNWDYHNQKAELTQKLEHIAFYGDITKLLATYLQKIIESHSLKRTRS